mgnify:CR=1 FL=1
MKCHHWVYTLSSDKNGTGLIDDEPIVVPALNIFDEVWDTMLFNAGTTLLDAVDINNISIHNSRLDEVIDNMYNRDMSSLWRCVTKLYIQLYI